MCDERDVLALLRRGQVVEREFWASKRWGNGVTDRRWSAVIDWYQAQLEDDESDAAA